MENNQISWAMIAQNIATNGRLFCSMLFVACLAAFIAGHGAWFARLAILAALVVGSSCIIDQLPAPLQKLWGLLNYALAALVAFLFLVTIG